MSRSQISRGGLSPGPATRHAGAGPVDAYLDALRERVLDELRDALTAILLSGSAGARDLAPTSDLDVIVVSARSLASDRLRRLASRLSHRALPCPARKLELVLYAREALSRPEPLPRFQLNLNTGEGLTDHVGLDPAMEPRHWFLIDLSIARELGRALCGPPPQATLPAVPRRWLLDAAREGLDWATAHEPGGASTVLNACRARRYAEEEIWSTKSVAAAWAVGRTDEPDTVRAAVASRAGLDAPQLEPARVSRVADEARLAIAGAVGDADRP